MGETAQDAPQSPGSTRGESHRRLRREAWKKQPRIKSAVSTAKGSLQTVTGGTYYIVYDEYSIIVDAMPAGMTPEGLVTLLATDLNKTVNDGFFSTVNKFKRRRKGLPPRVGEIIDIDINGPDNGSVMLVELTDTYFIYQCITTSWGGTHPEYGSREFGFERLADGTIKIYTRGVSSPTNRVVGFFGAGPQQASWARLMRGISDTLDAVGGKPRPNSFAVTKWSVNK